MSSSPQWGAPSSPDHTHPKAHAPQRQSDLVLVDLCPCPVLPADRQCSGGPTCSGLMATATPPCRPIPGIAAPSEGRPRPRPQGSPRPGCLEVWCESPALWPRLHSSKEPCCSSVTPARSSRRLRPSPRPALPRLTVSASPDVCILRTAPRQPSQRPLHGDHHTAIPCGPLTLLSAVLDRQTALTAWAQMFTAASSGK